MSLLHDFERRIDDKLRSLLRSPQAVSARRELIEVHRAILDDVSSHVELLPRGRRAFTSTNLQITVLLPDASRRRSYEIVFAEGNALARDIRERLQHEQVELPEDLHVSIDFADELPEDIAARGFDIRYGSQSAPARAKAQQPAIALTVVHGKADRESYSLSRKRINLGRLTDVVDANRRIVRRNDVAFAEENSPPNSTVSRTHAHIEYDTESCQYRLYDDRSAYGTTVLRNGEALNVAKGASKGLALEDGDEVLLGQARLRFELSAENS